jgi:hypothetical protein
VGQSLGDLAVSELPEAQAQFKGFADAQGLSTEAQLKALELMPEYAKQLEEQAALYGVDLYNAQTGAIEQEKLLAFGRGEGEVAIIRQTEALREQAATVGEAIASSVASMQFQDGQLEVSKKSYEQYLEELRQKTEYNNAEIAASTELLAKGVTTAAIEYATAQGVSLQEVNENLANSSAEQIAEFNRKGVALSSEFNVLIAQMGVRGLTQIEQAALDAYIANEINLDEFLAITKQKLDGYEPSIEIKNDTATWDGLSAKLKQYLPSSVSVQVNAKAGTIIGFDQWWSRMSGGVKDGGFIKPLKFASGGMASGGGSVFGAGGPRDDRVPAMLSAGEYVINALSTKRYKPLLEAINNGSPVFANTSSAGGSSPSINIVVNPSAGMDERELASAVSREITFQMRRGAVS